MTVRSQLAAIARNENINFLLTNRIPRRLLTNFIGWLSKIEHPAIRGPSLAIWRTFADLDLSDAKQSSFRSMHECFTRELKEGARPITEDAAILVSPCDAIIGAAGEVIDGSLFQVKGFPYSLRDLFDDDEFVKTYAAGRFVTLRLTSSMYHRFHAPHDCTVERVAYLSGDTWNVNPIALHRIEKLFCKNERGVIRTCLQATGDVVTLVPVAAILVASIHLNWLADTSVRNHAPGHPAGGVSFRKGDEMGRFEHGSTIIVFVPKHFTFCADVQTGNTIKMGQPLFRITPQSNQAPSSP